MRRLNSPFLIQETIELVGSAEQLVRFGACLRAASDVAEQSQSMIALSKKRPTRPGEAPLDLSALSRAVAVLDNERGLLMETLTAAQMEATRSPVGRLSRLEEALHSTMRRLGRPAGTRAGYRRVLRELHRIGWIVRSWKIQCRRMASRLYLSLDG